jgi:cell division protein FtsL
MFTYISEYLPKGSMVVGIMQPRRKYRIRWFRLAVFVVIGYGLYVAASQHLDVRAVNREVDATRTRVEQLKQQNKTLAEEKTRLTTPAYVEKLAREELGLVKPGEIPYIPAGNN